MKAIETMYAGTRFRSRLEARWGAFFDLLGWSWEYEPLDLDGYIPDFVLDFARPVLVEVKPAWDAGEMLDAVSKIARSGWEHEALVVGCRLLPEKFTGPLIGQFARNTWRQPGGPPLAYQDEMMTDALSFGNSGACLYGCGFCKRPTFCHETNAYACRVSGCWDGDHQLSGGPDFDWPALWREAGNLVQWMPRA